MFMAVQSSLPNHILSSFSALSLILFQSISHLKSHLPIFASIFLVLSLPLSLLFSSLISSSRPMQSRILLLQALSVHSSTAFEAWEMWHHARDHAISLFRLKLCYLLPCAVLSLATAVTTVSSIAASLGHRPISIISSLKGNWLAAFATSICNYAILFAYSCVPKSMAIMLGGGAAGVALWGIGLGFEWYFTSVMNMSLVISITDNIAGWDAIVAASDAMEGNRICGFLLAVLMELCGGIAVWRMGRSLEDNKKAIWTRASGWEVVEGKVQMGWWELPSMVVLYAILVVLGFIVSTVFYFECKKRQIICRDESVEVQNL